MGMCKGFQFSERHVNDSLTAKYGKSMQRNPDTVHAAPVSIQIDEDFMEQKQTSMAPHKMAEMCARELVCKPPLTARERRERAEESFGKHKLGTLASWQKTCLTGKTAKFQKPAF